MHTTPLLVDVRTGTFEDSIASLAKTGKMNYRYVERNNTGLEYISMTCDRDPVKRFIDLWSEHDIASEASACLRRGTPASRPTARGGGRKHLRYDRPNAKPWGYRAVCSGRKSVRRTGGCGVRTPGGAGGGRRHAPPDPGHFSLTAEEQREKVAELRLHDRRDKRRDWTLDEHMTFSRNCLPLARQRRVGSAECCIGVTGLNLAGPASLMAALPPTGPSISHPTISLAGLLRIDGVLTGHSPHRR